MRPGILAAALLLAALPAGPEGTFRLDRAASDDVGKAIERTAAEFNFLLRPFARSRLKKANPVAQQIRIVYSATEVSVQLDQTAPVRAPRDGRTVKWTRDDGAVFDLSARTEQDGLRQTFRGADGQRVNDFRLEAGGSKLTMGVTMTSPRLPKPLTYSLVYRKVG